MSTVTIDEKSIKNLKKEINSASTDELANALIALGIDADTFAKQIKKEKKNTTKDVPSSERLNTILSMNVDATKLSKRIFHNVEIDMDVSYIRDLVNMYYIWQGNRIKISNQADAIYRTGGERNVVMDYFVAQLEAIEDNICTFLNVWTDRHPIGVWLKAQTGIGPVIAAGIISNFDVTKTRVAGGFWKYIGWDKGGADRTSRKKGQKINYSPKARVLAWKAASSFKMQSTRESCTYGKLYSMIKQKYIEKNNNGGFAENAKIELSMKNFSEDSDAGNIYRSGKLPDAHIDAMAMRYCAKMFLSHVFDMMYMYEYGTLPPVPYPIAHMNHAHMYVPQHIDVLIPHLNEKFPNINWEDLIESRYFMGLCEI